MYIVQYVSAKAATEHFFAKHVGFARQSFKCKIVGEWIFLGENSGQSVCDVHQDQFF